VTQSRAVRWLLTLLLVGWVALPAGWVILNSFRPKLELRSRNVVPWVQFEPTLANWRQWLGDERLLRSMQDSAWIAVASTAIAVALGTPAAYALARFRFRYWRNSDLFVFFLSQRILPPVVTVLPFFILARYSGTFDSRLLLIAAHATFHLPLVVLLLRSQFAEIPAALEESAAVEGCGPLRFFLLIAGPASFASIMACTLVVMSFSWNEFLFGLLLTSREVVPLPRFIQSAAENDWGIQLDAVAVIGAIAVLPPTLFGWLTYRFLLRGLSLGAVK
jgi:multiple sugar transport system permease protein